MFYNNKKNNAKSPSQIPTVIARDVNIMGNIINYGGIIDFNGTLDGNITCDTITIRANGTIRGEITADNVQVYGKVDGLIKAKNVTMLKGCHIEGIVMHEQLSMEDGAFLDGKCKRTDKQSAANDIEADDAPKAKPLKILENIRLIS